MIPPDQRFEELKIEGTVQFLYGDPSASMTKRPMRVGPSFPAVFHLVVFHFDKELTAWFGAADVACETAELTQLGTEAGMPPLPEGAGRDLMDFLLQIRLEDGRVGAAHVRSSIGTYETMEHHRVDFIGKSKLTRRP